MASEVHDALKLLHNYTTQHFFCQGKHMLRIRRTPCKNWGFGVNANFTNEQKCLHFQKIFFTCFGMIFEVNMIYSFALFLSSVMPKQTRFLAIATVKVFSKQESKLHLPKKI